jgi:hypothetical protein
MDGPVEAEDFSHGFDEAMDPHASEYAVSERLTEDTEDTNQIPTDPTDIAPVPDHLQEDTTMTVTPVYRRPPQSRYFIKFWVAGIERSNVKNPIVRFDAKVTKPLFYSQESN